VLGGATAAWPLAARAQQGDRIRRIGILTPYPKGDPEMGIRVRAFREELGKLGWTDGANVQFDERWTADHMDRVWAEAASLIASNPDAILATGGVAAYRHPFGRFFCGRQAPKAPARMVVGNSEAVKAAWSQIGRRRFQIRICSETCW